jgi:hypothetical protein
VVGLSRDIMSAKRILKIHDDIVMTEVALSDGKSVISRAYSVHALDPRLSKQFGDMGAADTYFEELVLRRFTKIS